MEHATMPGQPRRPGRFGRRPVWCLFVLLLLLAPHLFGSRLSITLLSQMGIAVIACLSYNILLGQGGMLSFGHAVYTGLGAYSTIHALNAVAHGGVPIPLVLLPLVGGIGGLGCAVLLGYISTRSAGTPFAMITLGVAELVSAMSLMFPAIFGGDAGVSGNRALAPGLPGINFGLPLHVYYLIAGYTLVCVVAMFAFTGTPLGRLLNAVRDNPERVAFIGYNPQRIRYSAFMIAGFFAGIAGGLAALHFELVTVEVVGMARSGAYLLFTVLGGTGFFFGPIIGAVLMVLAFVLLSELTQAWLLYLGLIFLLMVIYAPGGIAGLLMRHLRLADLGRLRRLSLSYLGLAATGLVAWLGLAAAVEMLYHWQLSAALGDELRFAGILLHAGQLDSWVGAALVAGTGSGLFALLRHQFLREWQQTQALPEHQSQCREPP